jgi:hypothetical protein
VSEKGKKLVEASEAAHDTTDDDDDDVDTHSISVALAVGISPIPRLTVRRVP